MAWNVGIQSINFAMFPGIRPMEMHGETFLINLERDIAEMDNVSKEHPEIVNALK